ncbi:hypothetical protein MKW98_002157 [Papaver atlanticum]|uniref:NAC domain-containing protein n=1 Tax=Papaver atlanticum TaxID=357466 RepID=A0AAD4RUA1_9MAGN|nr:hypothetical protein MKW98_002157 [Papaver atlanticum]
MSNNNQVVMDEENHEAEDDLVPALPPGYRFYPTEEELITFYLHRKLDHGNSTDTIFNCVIPVVQIYDVDPWQLPEISGELCHRDKEQWFFFTPRQEREARGGRPNRTTTSGYWKATGSPSYVYSSPSIPSTTHNSNNHRVIGVKKTMVFYKGKAPTGRKTKWKMNEYRAIMRDGVVGAEQDHHNQTSALITNPSTTSAPVLRHEFSLCRIYVKSGCLRAFDRRPLGPPTSSEPVALTRHQHHSIAAVHNDQKTSSPSYQSSGDDCIQNQSSSREVLGEPSTSNTSRDDQWDMITTDDFNQLWDWEQLKWV